MMGFYASSILDDCPGRQCCKLSPKCAAVSAWGTGMHQLLLAKFTRTAAQFQSSDLGITLTSKSTPTKASNSEHQEVLRRDPLRDPFTTHLHITLLVSNVEIQQVGSFFTWGCSHYSLPDTHTLPSSAETLQFEQHLWLVPLIENKHFQDALLTSNNAK